MKTGLRAFVAAAVAAEATKVLRVGAARVKQASRRAVRSGLDVLAEKAKQQKVER